MSYTDSQKNERAEQARVLLSSDLFAEMLTTVRISALNELANVDATNADEIRRLQAIVSVTGNIKDNLEAVVIASGANDGGFSMTESPQGE